MEVKTRVVLRGLYDDGPNGQGRRTTHRVDYGWFFF